MPYLILLLGFCFTLLVYHYFSKLTHEQDEIRFERSVQEIQDQVRLRIETSTALLRAGTGLFAASDAVDAGEFERFVQQIELQKNYPGIQGIGFSRRFRREEMDSVIATMEREGKEGFGVWPEDPPREEYTAILYLEPATDSNKFALGLRHVYRTGPPAGNGDRPRYRKANRIGTCEAGPGTRIPTTAVRLFDLRAGLPQKRAAFY